MQQVVAGANAATRINENFDAISGAAFGARRHAATTGLTWGYYGGRFNGVTVADGTVTLTNSTTNYVVAHRTTGVVSTATTTTNWDSTTYARLYAITTSGGQPSVIVDHRLDTNGLLLPPQAGTTTHAVPIMAAAMQPSASGGCASLATVATAANRPDVLSLDFDSSSAEYAQFAIPMPSSWDEGTLTFKIHWSHAATATNFGTTWKLQAVAVGDDDTISVDYGTAAAVSDTGGTTNDLYTSAMSAAMTVAGTPQPGDMVYFRLYRDPTDGSDTMAIDARLHGVSLFIGYVGVSDT